MFVLHFRKIQKKYILSCFKYIFAAVAGGISMWRREGEKRSSNNNGQKGEEREREKRLLLLLFSLFFHLTRIITHFR